MLKKISFFLLLSCSLQGLCAAEEGKESEWVAVVSKKGSGSSAEKRKRSKEQVYLDQYFQEDGYEPLVQHNLRKGGKKRAAADRRRQEEGK
jgi:hypothetical protein